VWLSGTLLADGQHERSSFFSTNLQPNAGPWFRILAPQLWDVASRGQWENAAAQEGERLTQGKGGQNRDKQRSSCRGIWKSRAQSLLEHLMPSRSPAAWNWPRPLHIAGEGSLVRTLPVGQGVEHRCLPERNPSRTAPNAAHAFPQASSLCFFA